MNVSPERLNQAVGPFFLPGVSTGYRDCEKIPSTDVDDQILAYLNQHATNPERLAAYLGTSSSELSEAVDGLQARGWIGVGAAWFGDPSTATTILSLTPAGRKEAERREAMTGDEPVLLSRDELVSELRNRFGWTEDQLALNPHLRGDRFIFWPSVSAWSAVPPE
jgi:DNA-binding MarR family transcriptional regulator